MTTYVRSLADDRVQLADVGGKGLSLARLAAAGFDVPSGFLLTTDAYAAFVAEHRLAEALAGLAGIDPADTAAVERAATTVRSRFLQPIPEVVREEIVAAYRRMGRPAVAVRSSATAEDLPEASFAGQQDSFLNVCGVEHLLEAVSGCWASLWTARAVSYRARQGLAGAEVRLAVVVQELVAAEAAGVLFTADPVTGASDTIEIDAAWGLGEAVVGGLVTPDVFRADRSTARLTARTINAKQVMTVLSDDGAREAPVPEDQVRVPSMTDDQVQRLARLGRDLERFFGHPVDVEWARQADRLFVLQARPITTGQIRDPWNDSRAGDYLWTNTNLGEAVPDVMTPATWGLMQIFMADAMATSSVPPYVAYGRIGGRAYLNLSMAASIAARLGLRDRAFRSLTTEVFGQIPAELQIPRVRVPFGWVLRRVLPVAARVVLQANRDTRRLPHQLAAHPERCAELQRRIAGTDHPVELARLWRETVEPGLHAASLMLNTATRSSAARALVTVRRRLQKQVGDQDTEALLSGLGSESGQLASLGLLVGLERLRSGDIDRGTFNRSYGHRGPHEFEVSLPRPGEDPGWLDAQLEAMGDAVSVSELLGRQESRREEAWSRFGARYPHQVESTAQLITRWATASRRRELARSEVVRYFWVLRTFLVRVGAVTGVGDDVFFHDLDEVLALLEDGTRVPGPVLAQRRSAHRRYAALPNYPSLIRGSFDPFRWATSRDRRSDVFSADGPVAVRATVSGFPGSDGVVEGLARVVPDVVEAATLRSGEVLVTSVTNVGWTPVFPRAAAVVTDVGAPLSHAAIVARELGIPAVVGCGNATMLIATGDRLRVDGSAGTVEIL